MNDPSKLFGYTRIIMEQAPTPPTPPTPPAPPTPPPAPAAAPVNNTIQYDDFVKIELVVATVLEAAVHPNADKLLVLQVDVGNGEKRQICAGVKAWYEPSTLVGKQIIVVKNLAPRPLRGQISHGMLLAATDAATGNVVVLSPSAPVAPGSTVK